MRIKFSYFLALGLAAGIGFWMSSGTVVIGGKGESENSTPPPAARQEQVGDAPFRVKVQKFDALDRQAVLEVRGRTEAEAKVAVRAETADMVVDLPAREGSYVQAGDVLCVLKKGTRQASILEAKALLAQATLDHEAATKLVTKGFTAETRVAGLKAALDAAKARLEEAELELDRTVVRAPIDGVIQSPMADVGSRLKTGDVCATIVNTDPMIAIGQVSEVNIGQLSLGMPARVQLIDGKVLEGKVRYISPAADPDTRTFRIEVELPNAKGEARDGTTALTLLPLPTEKAHKITPAILTLDDAGRVGVRTVDPNNRAAFMAVKVLGGETDGVWVSGLPDTVNVIVVGQDYVSDGELVEPVFETAGVAQ